MADDRYTGDCVRSIVAMNPTGRLTLPADARRALGLRGETFFEVHLEANAIVLKPVAIVPLETVRPQAAQQPAS
ncbi:MAG TPA: AbrB/MazE/SpoVT family DNA-binding domain-containing protein [Candidatus Dormibacteraeota bacterium]|nr:AbrB/MazE/SpoVT family DNA-binding domain-containing protein [Candidatus Dormibacteraeota bacterium]